MELGFDIYAMVQPKTPEDYLLVLDEALSEARNLSDHLDALTKSLEADQNGPTA